MSRDPQQFSGERQDEWLSRSFGQWEAGEPSANAWESLDETLSNLPQDQSLHQSFDEWDAGEPSAQAWESLGESLSVEAVWNRVGQSLVAEEHLPDEWIAAAHSGWSPQPEHDGWDKLNDAISLEQVWKDLDHSLNQPVRMRLPIWKLAAASIAALFLSQQFSDAPVSTAYTANTSVYTIPAATQPVDSPVNGASGQPAPGTVSYAVSDQLPEREQGTDHPQRNAGNGTPDNNRLPNQQHIAQQQRIQPVPEEPNSIQQPLANQPIVQTPAVVSPDNNREALADLTDLTMDSLQKRSWSMEAGDVALTPFPLRPLDYHHWTVQLGTQLSVLHERNQALFTSTFPRLGLAADVSYRHRAGSMELIHALGMSQYSQGAGKYVNGRYMNTNQHINTLQFSSSIGHTYKRFTFYGGIFFSKMLSGLEKKEKKNAVTKVYDFNEVQAGITAGIDYRIATFNRSGNAFSVGTQYQWLPTFTGQKTAFENIQGIRFQAKISF